MNLTDSMSSKVLFHEFLKYNRIILDLYPKLHHGLSQKPLLSNRLQLEGMTELYRDTFNVPYK